MLLKDRVLWGAFVSVGDPDPSLPGILARAADIDVTGKPYERLPAAVGALACSVTTSVEYTRSATLLRACASSTGGGQYAFPFLSVSLNTEKRTYYCFFVPFRSMVGGVLRRINASLRGKDYSWYRLDLRGTVEHFRTGGDLAPGLKPPVSVLCGLDLHLMGARGEQEIIFVGANPAETRVFDVVTDESSGFTLSPISATFCVTSDKRGMPRGKSYFTVDRSGIVNVHIGSSPLCLIHMLDLLSDLEQLDKLVQSPDRPVYRSRNAHKKAILSSISA